MVYGVKFWFTSGTYSWVTDSLLLSPKLAERCQRRRDILVDKNTYHILSSWATCPLGTEAFGSTISSASCLTIIRLLPALNLETIAVRFLDCRHQAVAHDFPCLVTLYQYLILQLSPRSGHFCDLRELGGCVRSVSSLSWLLSSIKWSSFANNSAALIACGMHTDDMCFIAVGIHRAVRSRHTSSVT